MLSPILRLSYLLKSDIINLMTVLLSLQWWWFILGEGQEVGLDICCHN